MIQEDDADCVSENKILVFLWFCAAAHYGVEFCRCVCVCVCGTAALQHIDENYIESP